MTQTRSKEGHTPGPWEVLPSETTSWIAISTPSGSFNIGKVRGSAAEGRANARLIAKAPDMKEALADLLADFPAPKTATQKQRLEEIRRILSETEGKEE